jgi:hypothetical protein
MERNWSVRFYREGDEKELFKLWKAVYPDSKYDQEQWLRRWHWLYKGNPAGASCIALADHEGSIVGQQAAIPIVMKIGTEVATCFQSIDAMTHPAYRRQGVYQAVNKALFTEIGENNMSTGYSFPNDASHRIAVTEFPYFDVAKRIIILKVFNWRNTLKVRIKNTFLLEFLAVVGNLAGKIFCRAKRAPIVKGLTISRISFFNDRVNEFWDRVSSHYPIMVVRNKDYLNWRYTAVPDINYTIYIAEKAGEINGYLVLRCRETTCGETKQVKACLIYDILAQSEETALCLISQATEECKQEVVDLIYASMLANKMLFKAFRRNGYISPPTNRSWFIAYSSSQDISKEFLMNAKNWFIQIGDSDEI